MLTCKVGESIINCFDGVYDKHQLKKWSDKNILVCPDCGKNYEYCHGQIIHPYFRHKEKNKDCEGIYYEPETEEHIQGKLILYNWLIEKQKLNIIQNLKLEAYIPETKQRPDIYFEYNNKRFVIEFQCTPIATEYLERHELYELAGIKDIWVLGTEKYKIEKTNYGSIEHSIYFKSIEQHTETYLNTVSKKIYMNANIIKSYFSYNNFFIVERYCELNLENIIINEDGLFIDNNTLQGFMDLDNMAYEQFLKTEQIRKQKIKADELKVKEQKEMVEDLNSMFKDKKYSFSYRQGYPQYYLWGIDFSGDKREYVFFVKDTKIDCCTTYEYTYPYSEYSMKKHRKTQRWGYRTGYNAIDSFESISLSKSEILSFVQKHIHALIKEKEAKIREEQYKLEKTKKIVQEIKSEKIILIDGFVAVSKDIRFKFMKNFNCEDVSYISGEFCKDIKWLKSINAKEMYLMIPKDRTLRGKPIKRDINDMNNIKRCLEEYGFLNIEIYRED